MNRLLTKPKRNTGVRMHVPAWLSDRDAVAPCICGQPLLPGQHHLMGEGETGMKRWFHMSCWNLIMGDDDDEWDEDDDEWDEE